MDPDDLEDIEIDFTDDTPPEDKGRPVAPDITPPDPDSEEIGQGESPEQYSERVRKRIAKESAKVHAERRAKEQAIRERDEAARIAREAIERANKLETQSQTYETGFVHQAKLAAESESARAAKDYTDAVANGDTQAMLDAQRRLTRAEMEKARYEGYVPPEPRPSTPQAPSSPQAPTAVPQATPEALQRQTRFLSANQWFGSDETMTKRAYEIDAHVQRTAPHLVGTDEYYNFIDANMRREFPDRYKDTPSAPTSAAQPTQAGVAPVNRGSGNKSPRKVTLSESQVRLCKRLGITPQQYAAELLKKGNG